MNIESNKIITKNESNENNQSHKIISSDVIDFLNLTESDKKKLIRMKINHLILNLQLIILKLVHLKKMFGISQ
jgi:hypothetical protein